MSPIPIDENLLRQAQKLLHEENQIESQCSNYSHPCIVLYHTCEIKQNTPNTFYTALVHGQTDLKVFVLVRPKEGWAHVAGDDNDKDLKVCFLVMCVN